MKKKFTSVLSVVLVLCAAAAVIFFLTRSKGASSGFSPVGYVQEILDDSQGYGQRLLKGFRSIDRNGAIFILGTPDYCGPLSDAFLGSERFDNIDGSSTSDGLPDFAGETVCSVACFSDFEALASAPDDAPIRELAVRSVLSAMDTLCYVSPYDLDGLGRKSLPKLIILASPYVSQKGLSDLDTLFAVSGCSIPVLEPVNVLAGSVPPAPRKKGRTIGVIDSSNMGCYAALLRQVDSCVQYGDIPSKHALTAFLDRYMSDGHSAPLDVLLVNDPGLDAEQLREDYARVSSVMNEESLTYGNLFAKDFRIVDAREALTSAAYSIMRSRNLFTHSLSAPACSRYMLIPREKAEEGLMFMEYNERFIPAD